MNRRQFLKSVGAVAPAVLSAEAILSMTSDAAARTKGRARPERKPNIIFILADDLGYGDLGCYGQQVIQTPFLDRMAKQGIRFTDCYAGSTVCAPSRCCLMTGYHTGHAYVRGNKRVPLRPEDVTVAEVLKDSGYTTGIVGKWGLGEPDTTGIPNRKGFDYWFGYLNQTNAHNYYPEFLWRNEEKASIPKGTYSHDLFTEEARDFIKRERDKPFFLYLAYTLPHADNGAYQAGEQGMPVPSAYPYTNKPWSQTARNHAAMITRMDRDIGRIMALLKDLGLDQDTIVFFSSDNGPHKEGGASPEFFDSNGPLRGIKRDIYDGGIRVPMIARWPGKIKPGRVSDQVWAFWDFLPTAAELAGAEAPAGIDGISMLPALLGRNQTDHKYLYWEFHERRLGQAVRMGKWKAIRNDANTPIELYDLETDIGEAHGLAAHHPEIVEKVAEIMESARTESEHWPVGK